MPWRGTALQAPVPYGKPFWNRRPRAWPRPSFLAAAKKSGIKARGWRFIPSHDARLSHPPRRSVWVSSSLIHPAMSASLVWQLRRPVSRIAQRSLASRPAHSRGHPYVTRYPKASAITTQRKISAPARYACGTQCLVLRPCCTLKQQGLRRRAWAAHGRRIVPWRGTALQAPNPPDAGRQFLILGSRNTLNSGGAVFDHRCFGFTLFRQTVGGFEATSFTPRLIAAQFTLAASGWMS